MSISSSARSTNACNNSERARPLVKDFLLGLPKTDLHIHVEGAMEPAQILQFAERHGLDFPHDTVPKLQRRMSEAIDLPSFIKIRSELLEVLRTEREFYEAALAYYRKSAEQKVVYVEMFFDPQCHTDRGIALDEVMAGLLRAGREAEKEFGLRSQLIMCFNRDLSAESAMATLQDSLRFKDDIIGVGLDNPEVEGFVDKFAEVYAEAKKIGYRLTTHCDVDQKQSLRNIRGALHTLQVERLDHGVNIMEEAELIAEARRRNIGFTACPTMRYPNPVGRLPDAYFKRVMHFLKPMLDEQLLVTIGTDDPGMMVDLYCGDLYLNVQRHANLSREEMITLAKNGFRMAWISESDKQAYLDRVDTHCACCPA
jgi:adenosine deaminase